MTLAVGFFDGVHLGHQAILKGADAVFTLSDHPLSVLAPERAPRLMMTREERLAAIRACGVADIRVCDFTRDLAGTEPEAFLPTLTGGRTDVTVRCGDNWRFGRGGRGDAAFLRAHGVGVEIVPYAVFDGAPISSSRIRTCLEAGELDAANAMLGRPFRLTGEIVRGKGVGREIGFPTLNVSLGRPVSLKGGVYAVEVAGRLGVANFGLAPTMGERAWPEPTLEVHLLEAADCSSWQTADVDFLSFLRPEQTFASVGELTRQIAADCERARSIRAKGAR